MIRVFESCNNGKGGNMKNIIPDLEQLKAWGFVYMTKSPPDEDNNYRLEAHVDKPYLRKGYIWTVGGEFTVKPMRGLPLHVFEECFKAAMNKKCHETYYEPNPNMFYGDEHVELLTLDEMIEVIKSDTW